MLDDITIKKLSQLCPAPAQVLLLGPDFDALAEPLRGAGYEVRRADASLRVDGEIGAIVAGEQALEAHGSLEALHRALRDGGTLLLPVKLAWGQERPPGSLAAPELVADLYENGFVLLGREGLEEQLDRYEPPPMHSGGPVRRELLVARRDPARIRGYRVGDDAEILALFHAAFPHDRRTLGEWRWRYGSGGEPRLSLAIDEKDRIVAHYGAYPVEMLDTTSDPPHRFAAFQIGDTMTAPWADHRGGRRTSLLARATQHFFHRYCAHQIGYNYGFNTGRIHRYYMRSVPGSHLLEPAPHRILDLEERRPAASGRWSRRVRGVEVERIEDPGAEFDELFERVAPAYRLLAVRDAERLRWRYRERPGGEHLLLALRRRGRLVGWGAFLRRERQLLWGDALFDPLHVALAGELLATALEEQEGQGVTTVEGWFPDRPAFWHAALGELGFERREEPQELAFIYMSFEEGDLERRLAEDLYYTRADSDLF